MDPSPHGGQKPHISAGRSNDINTSSGLVLPVIPSAAPTLDNFVKALKNRGVLDVHQVGLPGCQVVLPFGCELIENYANVVTTILKRYGFRQYDYPVIASESVFGPARKVLDLSQRLLVFGTESGLEGGVRLGGICPTGEATIYNHWRSVVRTSRDLPLLMFQRTRYVRPIGKGQQSAESIFKPMENADVFEFHAALGSSEASCQMFSQLCQMNEELAAKFLLPVIKSRRPLWTNRHEVSSLTHASDTILPNGKTLQVCCLYLQGDKFSKPFEITFKHGAERLYTHHVTGAVSRRLLLSHLYTGMKPDGSLMLHPSIAPRHVQLVYCGSSEVELEIVVRLQQRLTDERVRAGIVSCDDKARSRAVVVESRASGTPLTVAIQGKRFPQDAWKIVAFRSDKTSEEVFITHDIETAITGMVREAIARTAEAYEARVSEVRGSALRNASSQAETRAYLAERAVVHVPLQETKEVVEHVASWRCGEVLGFNDREAPERCIVTGELTRTTAFIARRI